MTREEAIAMIEDDKKRHHDELSGRYRAALTMAIEALQQEPKQGKWIQAKDIEKEYAVCTNCKHHGEFYMDYCPNCGSYNGGDEQ